MDTDLQATDPSLQFMTSGVLDTTFYATYKKWLLYRTQDLNLYVAMVVMAIAVALSHKAKLLVLDEATAGLDPIARDEVLDLLYDFMQDESHAVLLSSHITSDLDKIADLSLIHI